MNKPFVRKLAVAVPALLISTFAHSAPWDTQINDPTRFTVLVDFGKAAVLDRETGRVWERSPDTFQSQWLQAQAQCNLKNVGNRKGWRLPSVQELASLVDTTVFLPGPKLPAGHPFLNIKITGDPALPPGTSASGYWTTTSWSADPTVAWDVEFQTGVVANTSKSVYHWVWCVRGGSGTDNQ